MFNFTIPGEPVGKGRPKFSTFGGYTKAYTPEKTVNYENWVKCCFLEKHPLGSFIILENSVRMRIKVFVVPPSSTTKKVKQLMLLNDIRPTKKPDADNILKIIADSLNKIAYDDDKQIVSVQIEKYYSEIPRVDVQISEI